jgi:hypothetical protein
VRLERWLQRRPPLEFALAPAPSSIRHRDLPELARLADLYDRPTKTDASLGVAPGTEPGVRHAGAALVPWLGNGPLPRAAWRDALRTSTRRCSSGGLDRSPCRPRRASHTREAGKWSNDCPAQLGHAPPCSSPPWSARIRPNGSWSHAQVPGVGLLRFPRFSMTVDTREGC